MPSTREGLGSLASTACIHRSTQRVPSHRAFLRHFTRDHRQVPPFGSPDRQPATLRLWLGPEASDLLPWGSEPLLQDKSAFAVALCHQGQGRADFGPSRFGVRSDPPPHIYRKRRNQRQFFLLLVIFHHHFAGDFSHSRF